MQRITHCLSAFFIAILIAPASVNAQIDVSLHSHVVFDFQVDKLHAYAESRGLNLEEVVQPVFGMPPGADNVMQFKRVFGTIQLPRNMATIQPALEQMFSPPSRVRDDSFDKKRMIDEDHDKKFQPETPMSNVNFRSTKRVAFSLPVNLFIRFEFMNADAATEFTRMGLWPQSNPVTVSGKTFYYVPTSDKSAPDNLAWHSINDTTIEIGTTDYLVAASRRFFTPRLAETWSTMNDRAIRIAVDLESVNELVDELVVMGKGNVPAEFASQIELLDDLSTLKLELDLETDRMFGLTVNCDDDKTAAELNAVLTQYLNMAKLVAGGGISEISGKAPTAADAANQLMNSLQASKTDSSVEITIDRPANFDAAVDELATVVRAEAKVAARKNDIRQVALSIHNYHDALKQFPFNVKEPLSEDLSWRGRVSPFCEGPQINAREPHDSAENSEFADMMPKYFGKDGSNSNLVWVQHDGGGPTRFRDLTDGLSNTIMLIEVPTTRPWLKPGDISIEDALTLFASIQDGESLIVAFYDGSVREVKFGMDPERFKALLTFNGGEQIEFDW